MSSWLQRGRDIIPKSRIITESTVPLVCVVLRGGIGNRLFQIIAGLGYAERTGKQFVFVDRNFQDNFHSGYKATMEMLLAFFPTVKVYRGSGSSSSWSRYESQNCKTTDKFYMYEPIPDISGSVILYGFFQNELYFPAGYRAKFKVPLPALVPVELIQTINFEKTHFIHFRLGDYVDSNYDVGLTEYYKKAIAAIAAIAVAQGQQSNFLIFSDQADKLNLIELLPLNNYTIVPSNVGTWASLHLMSLCAGGICANSTFSWFGAYACRSTAVFMPSVWHKVIKGAPIPSWSSEMPA